MRNIILERLTLKNFKGIKALEIDFKCITNIFGENATGKTTVFDAFSWLLFDKDSKGRSKFEVQPLDDNNNVKHGLDTNVTAILNIDGAVKVISKTLKEKWVKQRGQAEAELKGTTTTYEVDEIPIKLTDYKATINQIINEDLFKMVTNPAFFPNMKWEEQRKILLEIIGDLEENSVINYNNKLNPLRDMLTDGIDNFNKRTKASISKLKDQVKSIPYRIDECNNSIKEVDITALDFRKRGIVASINSLDEQITDSSKASEEKLRLQDKLFKLKDDRNNLINSFMRDSRKPLREVEEKIANMEAKARKITFNSQDIEQKIKRGNLYITAVTEDFNDTIKKQEKLREQWFEESKKQFELEQGAEICPCCNRPFEPDDIDRIRQEALEKFEMSKKAKLQEINSKGKMWALDIDGFKKAIESKNEEVNSMSEQLKNTMEQMAEIKESLYDLEKERQSLSSSDISNIDIPGVRELEADIKLLEEGIDNFKTNDNTDLKIKKRELQEELELINRDINQTDVNKKLEIRIEELKKEEEELNIKIAELEGKLFLGEEFIRTKVELLEGKINEKFEGTIAFKLFNQQVNGGLSECCEALIEGVPFGNANTASQINAGLSIINVLSNHYDVQAPIFIDNRESVNSLVDMESQIVNLIVSKDKKMKVEVIG